MTIKEIETKAKELRELKRMADDLDAEINALEDEIKAHMTAENTDTVIAGEYKITWKETTSTRVDTTALKKALPEVVQKFLKTTVTRRFLVA